LSNALALVLTAHSARELGAPVPAKISAALEVSKKTLAANQHLPLARALLSLSNGTLDANIEAVLAGVQAEHATIDRAVTLALVHGALAKSAPAEAPKLSGAWRKVMTLSGQIEYRAARSANLPLAITLDAAPAPGTVAIVRYDSTEKAVAKLPVSIERRFYRVRKSGENSFALEPVGSAEAFMTDGLYLDEIKLSTTKPQQFGMVEAPLPPGANVESTTWGINITSGSGSETEALPRATAETTAFGYGVPVETLSGESVVRHLVRFAQTGRFTLPPVRYYGMYTPMNKAVQALPRDTIEVR
jgi:alpha-2-macroglobulin